jgi:hypothetical protein
MCSPGLEVEIELSAPLALAWSVGDEDLDHIIRDRVGNAAPAVEEVPQVGAEGWIGKSNTHGEDSPCMMARSGPGARSRNTQRPSMYSRPRAEVEYVW